MLVSSNPQNLLPVGGTSCKHTLSQNRQILVVSTTWHGGLFCQHLKNLLLTVYHRVFSFCTDSLIESRSPCINPVQFYSNKSTSPPATLTIAQSGGGLFRRSPYYQKRKGKIMRKNFALRFYLLKCLLTNTGFRTNSLILFYFQGVPIMKNVREKFCEKFLPYVFLLLLSF